VRALHPWGVGQLTSSFHFGHFGRRRFLALVYAGMVVDCVGGALLRDNLLGAGSTAVMFALGLAIYLHPKEYARELARAIGDALPFGFPTEPLKRRS
jgi:hypothetical protein